MARLPQELFLEGPPSLRVKLRPLKTAKRLTLRVSATTGEAVLTLPPRLPLTEARAFVQARESWLRAHVPDIRPLRFGDSVPFGGAALRLEPHSGRGILRQGETLLLPAARPLGPSLAAYLRVCAREALSEAADAYAAKLGRPYRRLTLRDTRSRWGSCTSAGDLMFNWRLIMAPPDVLRYVAAHEVAHLQEMNHAPAFWQVVSTLMPHWQAQRDWLKREGAALQQISFDA